MLAFLCVSINNTATQSTGNVVLAVLYDCKDTIAVVWFSYYFINVDFFFIPAFQISQKPVYWKIWSGKFSPSELMHTQNCLTYLMNSCYIYTHTHTHIHICKYFSSRVNWKEKKQFCSRFKKKIKILLFVLQPVMRDFQLNREVLSSQRLWFNNSCLWSVPVEITCFHPAKKNRLVKGIPGIGTVFHTEFK